MRDWKALKSSSRFAAGFTCTSMRPPFLSRSCSKSAEPMRPGNATPRRSGRAMAIGFVAAIVP
jgi:hypothetical protein